MLGKEITIVLAPKICLPVVAVNLVVKQHDVTLPRPRRDLPINGIFIVFRLDSKKSLSPRNYVSLIESRVILQNVFFFLWHMMDVL